MRAVQAEQSPQEQAESGFLLLEPENCLPALQEGLKGLPLASAAFIFVILLEGEGGSDCCCPAALLDHTSLLRCVSLFVKGEMVSGPTAKGQGSIIECSVPGELGEEQTAPGHGEIHSQFSQVKLIDDMICPVLRDQGLGLFRETNTQTHSLGGSRFWVVFYSFQLLSQTFHTPHFSCSGSCH